MEDLNSGHNIRATVFLECREMYRAEGPPELRSIGETQFVAGVSAMSESGKYGVPHACAGIIGNVDSPDRQPRQGRPGSSTSRCRVAASAASANGATWHADPSLRVFTSGSGEGLYLDRAWRDGFAALAPLNLSFEAWMFHSQLGDLIDLARAFPETKIVLNHIGGALAVGPTPRSAREVFEEWRTQMQSSGNSRTSTSSWAGSACPR